MQWDQLYAVDRSEIIWTDADITQFKATCSAKIAHGVDLAADDAIVIPTGKSKGRREAWVRLYGGLIEVLALIPRHSTTVLTNSYGAPWTRDGFGSSANKAKIAAAMQERNLHFHDLRGTAATRFYTANIPQRAIADIMGWEEEHVARIRRRYVGRSAATQAIIGSLYQRPLLMTETNMVGYATLTHPTYSP